MTDNTSFWPNGARLAISILIRLQRGGMGRPWPMQSRTGLIRSFDATENTSHEDRLMKLV
jgi:hypothetical protein